MVPASAETLLPDGLSAAAFAWCALGLVVPVVILAVRIPDGGPGHMSACARLPLCVSRFRGRPEMSPNE
jgi:hypothetical protein